MSEDTFGIVVGWLVPGVAVVTVVVVVAMIFWVFAKDAGTQRMQEIAAHIRSGAGTFLRAEYSILLPIKIGRAHV